MAAPDAVLALLFPIQEDARRRCPSEPMKRPLKGVFGGYFEAETMHNKRGRCRRQHLSLTLVVSVPELGGSSSSSSRGTRVAGCGSKCITRGTWGYKRDGLCREGHEVAMRYSMFCRPACSSPPSVAPSLGRHSSVMTAVRRRATGGPVLRQRAGPAGVNKPHHRHSTNPTGCQQHEQHSTHL